ncbi:MAG TPA: sigma-70 family RNA polymerase sigma factor [Verrucomicrobiae bacterium]|nr:sigma-70 family RNA polymerase sigma factor [Verrucomicrobiae bacterium]
MQDAELLREYLKSGSEAAFSELVKRYVDFVFSTARRQVGDAHLAQEVAQSVFCLLARKAAYLNGRTTIAGWLYRATCFTAARAMRAEMRRRRREQEAANMNQDDSNPCGIWDHLSPMLDEALNEIGETDRLAVLLRFFQRKPMREVGQILGVSEDAAKMRVSRAVERLRIIFAKRGVACSSAALGVLLAEKTVEAAPMSMASSITSAAVSGAAASTLPLTQVLVYMAKIKAQTLVVAGIAALVLFIGGLHVYNLAHQPPLDGAGRAILLSGLALGQSDGSKSSSGQSSLTMGNGAGAGSGEDSFDLNDAIARLRAALHATNDSDIPGFAVVQAVKRFGSHGRAAFEVLKEEAAAHNDTNAPTDDVEIAPRRAVNGVGFLGKSVPEAIPYLWNTYELSPSKKSDSIGYLALAALQQIGFEAHDIALLTQRVLTFTNFQESDAFIKGQTASWIATIIKADPVSAQPYIPMVANLLYDRDRKVRFWAACALVENEGAGNPGIIDAINAGLKTADKETLAWASKSVFQEAGAAVKPVVPALLAAANASDDKIAREWAFLAAGNISGELRNEVAEVDQVLKKDEDAKSWLAKINSGTATYDDLAPHLKEAGEACLTANYLEIWVPPPQMPFRT